MSSEHKDEEVIYHEAATRPPAERNAYLQAACGENGALIARIEALLKAREIEDDFLKVPPLGAAAAALDGSSVPEAPGATIGRYKLLERIGEGGMAVVYMAEQQEPIRCKVALKIIKLGMDTKSVIARFEAERQALALMDHPNVAKVLDAGATETGRPYFVMGLVKGASITDYCDANSLSTDERLKLFMEVCNAVQHAHQKGIIHRDIKPSNVMVALHDGKPVPKVIDFGIAKATNQRLTEKTVFTRYAQMIGTPAYMSPEQAEMSDLDIDTRTDIYSLGVLLYELLTGTTPFSEEELRQASYLEMQRIIAKQEPTKPSTKLSTLGDTLTDVARRRNSTPDLLRKAVRGDLDWIVMKALEKQRQRRYDTANALAMDIQRHLDHEPVRAAAPSLSYKTRKFVRRNRALVAGVAAVLVVFITGFVVSTALYIEADKSHRQEAAARAEADRLRIEEALQRKNAEAERDKARQAETLAEQRRNEAVIARDEAERQAKISDAIATFLRSATRLDLPASEISGTELEHLAGSHSLRSLSVPQTPIGDEDLAHLQDVVSLEGLFLGKTQVTDAGMANLKDLTALRALCVHDTQVGDAGLAYLKNMRSLEYLCLAGTRVTDAGLVHLRGLTSLQDLRLAGTQVTQTGINELRRLLPDCRILGADGSTVYGPTPAPADGRPPEKRQIVAAGWKASWSPDGNSLVFGRREQKGLQILDIETGQTTDLTSSGKDPAWSPDGRFIAYVQGAGSSEEIWLVESNGQKPRKLMDGGFPGWSADGKTLYVHSRSENKLFAVAISEPESEPQVFFEHPVSWYPAVSPDGTRIAFGAKDVLIIVDRQKAEPILIWPTPGHRGLLPTWSPDGRLVAFGGFDNEPFGVWVLKVASGEAVQVADGPFTMPAWSPDGTKLAFDLRSEGVREIWMIQTETIQGRKVSAAEAARLGQPPTPPTSQPGPSGTRVEGVPPSDRGRDARDTSRDTSPLIGKPAPGFTLQDINGRQVSLSDFKGKVVLLDFWATWCGPCVKAIPHLEALYHKYKEEGLVILGLNNEPDQAKVRQFAEGRISYIVLLGADKQFAEYGVKGIPTLFFMGRAGRVRYVEIGFSEGREKEMEVRIRSLLGLGPGNESGPAEGLGAVAPQPAGDLVGWWRFDETEGGVATDSSGRGHHGSLIGNPQWQPGRLGGALAFDGQDDYVLIKDTRDFNITKEITVACWINIPKFDAAWQAIIAKGNHTWRLIRAQYGGNIEFACTGVNVPNTPFGNVYGRSVVDDGRWHHLAGVYDGTHVSLYMDGVLDGAIEGTGSINSNDDYVLIGANAGDAWRYWHGLIDDVRVYSYALSEAQVKEVYAGRGPGPNTKLPSD